MKEIKNLFEMLQKSNTIDFAELQLFSARSIDYLDDFPTVVGLSSDKETLCFISFHPTDEKFVVILEQAKPQIFPRWDGVFANTTQGFAELQNTLLEFFVYKKSKNLIKKEQRNVYVGSLNASQKTKEKILKKFFLIL